MADNGVAALLAALPWMADFRPVVAVFQSTEASMVSVGRPGSLVAVPDSGARGVSLPSPSEGARGGNTSSRDGGGRKSGRRGSSSEFERISALWRRASLRSDEKTTSHETRRMHSRVV